MKNRIKKSLSLLLVVIMLLTTAPLTGLDSLFASKASAAYAVGDHIQYGNYPQSKVTDSSTLALLESKTKNWISYGYYSGSGDSDDGKMEPSDYMFYADIDVDGDGLRDYRAVRIDKYRPCYTGYTSSSSTSYQDENGYTTGNIYYFKFEPIEWRILDPTDGLIMTEKIMDSQSYNNYLFVESGKEDTYGYRFICWGDPEKTHYANNYFNSSIRQWLNNDFYYTAFNLNQVNNIRNDVEIDNSAFSDSRSAYGSPSTKDKIYLLSRKDTDGKYYDGSSIYVTDYAKSQGLSMVSSFGGRGYFWWMRSAGWFSDAADYGGIDFGDGSNTTSTNGGVRPACRLSNLKNDIDKSAISTNIYNLGEETYSFDNFGDSDSKGGHCFGMSSTSSGYYLGKLYSSKIGCKNGNIYALNFSKTVTDPICFYQGIQGSKANGAIVAGGSSYLNGRSNISSDWNSVINYIKNHKYDDKGTLQIGFRVNGEGGHAINFLRYAVVDGQERIYAYDNNFPNIETYFYKDSNGEIHQAPKATFGSYAIDCIALRSMPKYFNSVGNYFESFSCLGLIGYIKHLFFAEKGTIAVENATEYLIDTDSERTDIVVFEVPETVDSVTITPLIDNASFTYLGDEYNFEKADGETTGTFTFSESIEENSGSLTINQITPTSNCTHLCHKGGFIWRIVRFFWKLFKMNSNCSCGVAHY